MEVKVGASAPPNASASMEEVEGLEVVCSDRTGCSFLGFTGSC